MAPERKRRRVLKHVYCIEGEVEVGIMKFLAEQKLSKQERHVSAFSEAQARKLFAMRLEQKFRARAYIGNAHIFHVAVLMPDPPIRRERVKQFELNLGL